MKKTKHNLYNTWSSMHKRCYNKSCKGYKDYGGRGITVCHRWHRDNPEGFGNFYKDMGARPEGMSLDRIDNNGNYEPSNCRWATPKDQSRNARSNKLNMQKARDIRYIHRNMKFMTINRIALVYGISVDTVKSVLCGRRWAEK